MSDADQERRQGKVKMLEEIARASDILERITAIPLMCAGGLMVVVVLVGTFWRYVLDNPILWTEEAARYLMIWMALIGASISMKRREHLGVEIVINRLPHKAKKVVQLVTSLFVAYFLYVLTVQGAIMAWDARVQVSPALGISMSWPLLSVPLTGLLTLIQLIFQVTLDMAEPGKAVR